MVRLFLGVPSFPEPVQVRLCVRVPSLENVSSEVWASVRKRVLRVDENDTNTSMPTFLSILPHNRSCVLIGISPSPSIRN